MSRLARMSSISRSTSTSFHEPAAERNAPRSASLSLRPLRVRAMSGVVAFELSLMTDSLPGITSAIAEATRWPDRATREIEPGASETRRLMEGGGPAGTAPKPPARSVR
jgi:hypothetical protein